MKVEAKSEFRRISVRLPSSLMDEVRRAAKKEGIPYQRFIRQAIEKAFDAPELTAEWAAGADLFKGKKLVRRGRAPRRKA